MADNTYAYKIRNHVAPYHPEAWQQMSELLDQKEKKRRFMWWLWPFGLVIILLMAYGLYDYTLPENKTHSESSEKKQELSLKEKGNDTREKISDKRDNSEKITTDPISLDRSTMKLSTTRTMVDDTADDNLAGNTNNESDYNTSGFIIEEKAQETIKIQIENENTPEVLIHPDEEKRNFGIYHPISNKQRFIEHDEQVQYSWIEPLQSQPKLFYTFGGGFAMINNHQGWYANGGLIYEMDKVISLESNLSYSYGSKKSYATTVLPILYSRQVDLNFLAHLNFIRNARHKLSFELGTGYSFYYLKSLNNNPPEIYIKDWSGQNLQGGFSYTYYFQNYNAISLRLGVIAFDDAVTHIGFKWIKNI